MKTIYNEPFGRLCNRMRALYSAIFLSKEIGASLTVIWDWNDEIYCPVEKILPNDIILAATEL